MLPLLAMATLFGPPPEAAPTQGTATFTDLVGGGACSFPGEPPDNLHVGLPSTVYGTADLCGAYLDVTGPGGRVRVLVTDHCPQCSEGLVDVSRRAFEAFADPAQGRTLVTYQLVRDPPLAAPISLRVKDGSSVDWWALQVLDHGNALAAVEIAGPDGDGWRALERSTDNWWLATSPGPGVGPFSIRITDVYGQSVTVGDVALAPGRVQGTSVRLYPAPPAATESPPGAVGKSPPTTTTPVGWPDTDLPSADVSPDVEASGSRSASGRDVVDRPRSSGRNEAVGPVFVILAATVVALAVVARRRV